MPLLHWFSIQTYLERNMIVFCCCVIFFHCYNWIFIVTLKKNYIRTLITFVFPGVMIPICVIVQWRLSGSTPNTGRYGQPIASKQFGAGTMTESFIGLYMKQKKDGKMLWQMKLEPQRLNTMMNARPECQKRCYCCHRSLLSPIWQLKILSIMVFLVIIM